MREVLTQFQRAIKEYPDYYEAYAQVGMTHMNLGDAASSERMLRKSIALSDEQYVDAYRMLASLFTDGQRFAEAEVLARKAVELNANAWQGYFELARALYGLNNLADAQANATIAAELDPGQRADVSAAGEYPRPVARLSRVGQRPEYLP